MSHCHQSSLLIACLSSVFSLTIGFVDNSAVAAEAVRPNIVVILADDLGYGDLGCYGSSTIATPRIDRMAAEGVRFTDFSVASPFCSPSRAALLTGRLPARCGVPYVLFPSEHTGLPPEELTIAEVLQYVGYSTACVGKWHLGWRRQFRPQAQGFDEFFGVYHSNDAYHWKVGEPFHQLSTFAPLELREGDRVIEAPVDQELLTQRYTRRAIEFIEKNRSQPFFLYLSHTMPHVPQYASPEFVGKSEDGLYGDTVEELDWSTGAIVDTLSRLGLSERTLVIFLSDNGASVRTSNPNRSGGRFPGRSLGGNNGPLRAGKGTTFEGGVRVPAIAWWPETLSPGRVESGQWSTLDLMPTFASIAGASLPRSLVVDGIESRDALLGTAVQSPDRQIFHYFGAQLQAIREGRWKLFVPIHELPEPRAASLWFDHLPAAFERQHRLWPDPTLYDLSQDIGERNDLAAEFPEVVERLLTAAARFDGEFQEAVLPRRHLPGPIQPQPGQIRVAEDDLSAWIELVK